MEKVTRLIEEIEKILDNPNEGNLEVCPMVLRGWGLQSFSFSINSG